MSGILMELPLVDGVETVTKISSPYFGLAADDIPLLFQGWKDNCSTWLGRTDSSRFDGGGAVNGGWNCVKRYGQPGTIGARHIGEGTVETVNAFYATFVPDAELVADARAQALRRTRGS